jgi:hypothetical protein
MNIFDFVHCIWPSRQLYGCVSTGNRKEPVQSNEAERDLEQEKSELQMTFLPKTAHNGHEALNLLIGLPLTMLATGLLFIVIELGSRGLGA